MRDSSICKPLVEKYALFSDECVRMRPTWNYAAAFRAVAKRHAAIANLKPFAVAVLAEADEPMHVGRRDSGGNDGSTRNYDPPPPAYIYASKTLLYMIGRTLRILPLHGGAIAHCETVVDVRSLLDEAIPDSKGTRNYLFRPLHYSDGIVSCVYAHHRVGGRQECWLVLLNPETRWCTSHRLALPHHRLFVRNNKDYLVFGTYTRRRLPEQDTEIEGLGAGTDSPPEGSAENAYLSRQRRWVLCHYSFADNTWSTKAIFLDNSIGLADLGSSLCFEVIDGYFYALANHQRYLGDDEYDPEDDEEVNAGTDDFETRGVNLMDLNDPRHHMNLPRPRTAGPFAPSSYYTCVRFPISNPSRREMPTRKSSWRRSNDEGAVDDRWTTLSLEKCQATGKTLAVESRKEWLRASGSSSSRRTYYTQPLEWVSAANDATKSNISNMDQAASSDEVLADTQLQRRPEHVHPGDDAARVMPLTLSKCGARVYSTSSQTFMDLYYQNSTSWNANGLLAPQLILRAGTRRDRPPTLLEGTSLSETSTMPESAHTEDGSESLLYPLREINKRYVNRDVVTWPATHDGIDANSPRASELRETLNPPNYSGSITGTSWDDRLLIYSTISSYDSCRSAGNDGKQAIVIVSFDSTLCLPGLKIWENSRLTNQERANDETGNIKEKEGPCCSNGEVRLQAAAKLGLNAKIPGKDAETCWVSREEPMYKSIGRGFDFSYHIEDSL
ncbi:hypothetical protein SBRCBS47491_004322 [Sporothrix bragantina]|uniref:F-box domain containing protein n=1 Tax=Sporothrix bragantina TaxID=671064 RepID=A0ABP0BNP8_9PEZI